MGLGLIGSALVGGLGGAGGAIAESASEEIKQEALAKREAVLTRIRQQEHAANKASDLKMAEEQAAKERTRKAEIFGSAEKITREKAGGIVNTASATYESDEGPGEASATTTVNRQPTSAQRAEALMEAGGKAGDFEVVKEGVRQKEVARREDSEERRGKNEEERNRIAAIRAEADQMRAAASQETAAAATKRAEALVARAVGGGSGDGKDKDTARIRDIKFYAETVFGRNAKTDEEKAAALQEAALYVINKEDKSGADRIVQIAKELKDDPDWMARSYSDRLNEARRIVGTLEGDSTSRRGGVPSPAAPKSAGQKPAAKPPGQRPPLSTFDKR